MFKIVLLRNVEKEFVYRVFIGDGLFVFREVEEYFGRVYRFEKYFKYWKLF